MNVQGMIISCMDMQVIIIDRVSDMIDHGFHSRRAVNVVRHGTDKCAHLCFAMLINSV